MKDTFAKLVPLVSLWPDDARWVENVTGNVGADALGLLVDENGRLELQDFAANELKYTPEMFYIFVGGEYEEERFYRSKHEVMKCKATGEYWVLCEDEEDLMCI